MKSQKISSHYNLGLQLGEYQLDEIRGPQMKSSCDILNACQITIFFSHLPDIQKKVQTKGIVL
jgi:hypothetical protein